jgi:hypothetical protein
MTRGMKQQVKKERGKVESVDGLLNALVKLTPLGGYEGAKFTSSKPFAALMALPKWNLYGHYPVEPIGEDYFGNAGAFAYLQTDQVAFSRTARGENVPLSEVPALAFSEVMRTCSWGCAASGTTRSGRMAGRREGIGSTGGITGLESCPGAGSRGRSCWRDWCRG